MLRMSRDAYWGGNRMRHAMATRLASHESMVLTRYEYVATRGLHVYILGLETKGEQEIW